jgi:hypothetical protein
LEGDSTAVAAVDRDLAALWVDESDLPAGAVGDMGPEQVVGAVGRMRPKAAPTAVVQRGTLA